MQLNRQTDQQPTATHTTPPTAPQPTTTRTTSQNKTKTTTNPTKDTQKTAPSQLPSWRHSSYYARWPCAGTYQPSSNINKQKKGKFKAALAAHYTQAMAHTNVPCSSCICHPKGNHTLFWHQRQLPSCLNSTYQQSYSHKGVPQFKKF